MYNKLRNSLTNNINKFSNYETINRSDDTMYSISWSKSKNVNERNLCWTIEPNTIVGYIVFEKYINMVKVTVNLAGFNINREYGFHIHTRSFKNKNEIINNANCCSILGGHFNPLNVKHGSVYNKNRVRHVGDLCNNLKSDKHGKIEFIYYDSLISLNPTKYNFIGNKSVVIHESPDDLGRQGFNDKTYYQMNTKELIYYGKTFRTKTELMNSSLIDGNAGKRIACGNLHEFNN
jgi:Cu/Zn superoxide dismutase